MGISKHITIRNLGNVTPLLTKVYLFLMYVFMCNMLWGSVDGGGRIGGGDGSCIGATTGAPSNKI